MHARDGTTRWTYNHTDQFVQAHRKPIYGESSYDQALPTPQDVHLTTISPEPVSPPRPTPTRPTATDRLAVQVKKTRLFLHHYASTLETGVNSTMTKVLQLENDFTSTVRSVAPSRQSGERLLPGSIYVLVAAMAGSIVTRNRNILLRATVPFGTGLAASSALLPVTTSNVGDLVWRYEQRFPVIAHNHIKVKERLRQFVETGKAHSQMGLARVDEKLDEARESLQQWVQKGT